MLIVAAMASWPLSADADTGHPFVVIVTSPPKSFDRTRFPTLLDAQITGDVVFPDVEWPSA